MYFSKKSYVDQKAAKLKALQITLDKLDKTFGKGIGNEIGVMKL